MGERWVSFYYYSDPTIDKAWPFINEQDLAQLAQNEAESLVTTSVACMHDAMGSSNYNKRFQSTSYMLTTPHGLYITRNIFLFFKN